MSLKYFTSSLFVCILLSRLFPIWAGNPGLAKNFNTHQPFSFEENKGQLATDNGITLKEVLYSGKDNGMQVYCYKDKIAFVFNKVDTYKKTGAKTDKTSVPARFNNHADDSAVVTAARMEMHFENAASDLKVVPGQPQQVYNTYYLDNCPNGITTHFFNELTYRDIYPYIDLVLSTKGEGFEYSFIVRPGGNTDNIRMKWSGADSMQYLSEGESGIRYASPLGYVKESGLHAYSAGGQKVSSEYKVQGHEVTFQLGRYDKRQVLTIDPAVNWGTYFGGHGADYVLDIAPDDSNNIYTIGWGYSGGLATTGAFLTAGYVADAFFSKWTTSGRLIWSTYYGGDNQDAGNAIRVDHAGNIVVTGGTSSDSVGTSGVYQKLRGGKGDAFLAKFTPAGTRIWASYFGGKQDDYGWSLAVDSKDNIYLYGVTNSDSGIATTGAFQTKYGGKSDMFVARFSSSGTLSWATYFGGKELEQEGDITVDENDTLYFTATTQSDTGLATSGAYKTSFTKYDNDGFIAKFTSGGARVWSTYFGGSYYDDPQGISASSGHIYICGWTSSSTGIASAYAHQAKFGGLADGFLARFTTKGTYKWGTYFGGSEDDRIYGMNEAKNGDVYVTGYTGSTSQISTLNSMQMNLAGKIDAFMAKFDPNDSLVWGTYFGGTDQEEGHAIVKGKGDSLYLCGSTRSTSKIATSGAYQSSYVNSDDGFIASFRSQECSFVPSASGAATVCRQGQATYVAQKHSGNHYKWRPVGGIVLSGLKTDTVSVRWTQSGTDTLWLIESSATCSDSFVLLVKVLPISANAGPDQSVCLHDSLYIGTRSTSYGLVYKWQSIPAGFSSTKNYPVIKPLATTQYIVTVTDTNTGCSLNDTTLITLDSLPKANAGGNKTLCNMGVGITLGSVNTAGHTYSWTSKPAGFTSTASNPVVIPKATTTYYLTETVTATGCKKKDSAVIIVNPLPKANAGRDSLICAGQRITLGIAPKTGHSYYWTANPAGYISSNANPTITPASTATYYLKETIDLTGCTSYDTVTITVKPLPAAITGTNQSVCRGMAITLGSAPVSGNTYSWVSVPAGTKSSSSSITVTPDTTTTYYLTETTAWCRKTDSVMITVLPVPAPYAGSNRSICGGDSVTLGTTSRSGHSYSWHSLPAGFTASVSNPSVKPAATTTYYLKETNSSGCSKEDSVLITVDPLPKAITGGDQAICEGDSIIIGADSVKGHTYTWTSNPAGFSSSLSRLKLKPLSSVTYLLTETNRLGCATKGKANITVNPLPVAYTGTSETICGGTTVRLGIAPVSGHTYDWSSQPAGFTSSSSNPVVAPGVTTTYYLTETNTATGCKKSGSVTLTVNPTSSAVFTQTASGSTYTFEAVDKTLKTYLWTFGDSTTDTSGYQVSHIFPKNKTYTVTLHVMNNLGCTYSYDTAVSVTASGLAETVNAGQAAIDIYPNPFSNATTLHYTLSKPSQVNIEVLDMEGRKVATLTEGSRNEGMQECTFNAEQYHCPAGIYLVKVMIADQLTLRRVIRIK